MRVLLLRFGVEGVQGPCDGDRALHCDLVNTVDVKRGLGFDVGVDERGGQREDLCLVHSAAVVVGVFLEQLRVHLLDPLVVESLELVEVGGRELGRRVLVVDQVERVVQFCHGLVRHRLDELDLLGAEGVGALEPLVHLQPCEGLAANKVTELVGEYRRLLGLCAALGLLRLQHRLSLCLYSSV